MPWPKPDADHLIVSSSQMKDIEAKLFSFGMPVEALMEKVGLEMKKWFFEYPILLENGVVVLVGPGHNGGDGLVLARELFLDNIDVSLWCPLPVKKELTLKHLSYCNSIGIRELKSAPDVLSNALWIESVFGVGQTRELSQELALLFKNREKFKPGRLVSLDVPAGICSDTGKKFATGAAKASFTLSVGLLKTGLLQDIALPYVGDVKRIDLGIPEIVLKSLPEAVPLTISAKDIYSSEFPATLSNASKYQRGRVLFIGGSQKYKGASLLVLEGLRASGAGIVQAVLPPSVSSSLWKEVPEVVFHDHANNLENQEIKINQALSKIRLDRFESLVIGPGLGIGEENWEDCACELEGFLGLLVLDADALNRISLSGEGWKWLRKRQGSTWITPHMSEFCRLFPNVDTACPIKAASSAACMSGVSVLLKGAHSVIAAPNGSVLQLVDTSTFSARGGLGDVLAGFAGGIGALGISSAKEEIDLELFALAVLLHAHAASFCKEGTNASFIAKSLGKFVKRIQRKRFALIHN